MYSEDVKISERFLACLDYSSLFMTLQEMYHSTTINEVFHSFKTTIKGLSEVEATQRLQLYGLNQLKKEKDTNPLFLFFRQFHNFIVYVLLAATVISFLLGELLDATVILSILVANAILGFIQEYRAEKVMKALQKMTSLKARVIRDHTIQEIDAEHIVPGDIILLEEGDKVPADARLFEIVKLKVQESALTGESIPVSKTTNIVSADAILGDRKNMVYAGTIIAYGRGKAIAVTTGMRTELGKIATAIAEEKVEQTPLQKNLDVLGKNLGIATLFICSLIFIIGFYRTSGQNLFSLLLAAIALAVAAVPEGLPAIVTISLALGVQRMGKRHTLVRQLARVETLGCTSVICTDKTGTLTCNEMTVRQLYTHKREVEVSGIGYTVQGNFLEHGKTCHIADSSDFKMLLTIGVLCNNASLGQGKCIGDPTEASLLVVAAKARFSEQVLNKQYPRVDEIPFDSSRKMMSTVHHASCGYLICTKGAPEVILEHCTHILIAGHVKVLTTSMRKEITTKNEELALHALRVLGFAYKEVQHLRKEIEEEKLIFVGLQGMIDPPRLGVKEAVASCHNAGIRVVMVTGDYEITAKAIGKELGIGDRVLTGKELDRMNNEDMNLAKIVDTTDIFARVNPEHKLLIVKALRKLGYIVAMTGDGVNDAPALKSADIGIAMGISGTAVAKEASAMVLTDDHFVSIVEAVKEGRAIYDNIKKFVNYLLSSNLGEVFVLFFAMIIGFSDNAGNLILPLAALQILWLNLVTDGLPALALGIDPADPQIMERKPRHPKERLITLNMGLSILVTSLLITTASLILFAINLATSAALAQTVVFTSLVFMEIVRIYTIRTQYNIPLFSNPYLLFAIFISFCLQFLVVYGPLQKVFNTVPLAGIHWLMIITATIFVFAFDTTAKKIITGLTHERD